MIEVDAYNEIQLFVPAPSILISIVNENSGFELTDDGSIALKVCL